MTEALTRTASRSCVSAESAERRASSGRLSGRIRRLEHRRIVPETLVIRISRRRAVGSVASPVSASVASGHFVKHAASLSWA